MRNLSRATPHVLEKLLRTSSNWTLKNLSMLKIGTRGSLYQPSTGMKMVADLQCNRLLKKTRYLKELFFKMIKRHLQRFCQDSTIIYDVDEYDRDILIMTCIIGDVIAWRKFRRINKKKEVVKMKPHRKFSSPF